MIFFTPPFFSIDDNDGAPPSIFFFFFLVCGSMAGWLLWTFFFVFVGFSIELSWCAGSSLLNICG